MRRTLLLSILVLIPVMAFSQTNPIISKVEIAGVPEQTLSAGLRDTMQKLVGQRYESTAVDPIIKQIESEQPEFIVATRTLSDTEDGRIKLMFVLAPKSTGGAASDSNVNSRYVVESVEVKGVTRNQYSDAIYDDMQNLIGQMLDNMKVEDLRNRLRSEPELKGKYSVSDKIERGSQPEHVKLIFEATKLPWALRVTLGNKIDISGNKIDVNDVKDTDIVESAEVTGVRRSAFSDTLYSDIQTMVGKRVDHLEADHLKEKLESELTSRYSVAEKFHKGTTPNTVRIVYEAKQIPWIPERTYEEVASYHQKQGISLFADGNIYRGLTIGMGTDGDTLTERYKGFMVGYENRMVGTRRFGVKLRFDTFGILWKPQTLDALEISPGLPGAYRVRQAVEPSVAFAFSRSLHATAGLNLTELQMMLPTEHWESAHEATGSLRYQSPSLKHGTNTFEFTSGYEIRTATRNLDSDFVYTRHLWDASYTDKSQKSTYKLSFKGGLIRGNPPLFARFSMGDASTLRGWNKFDIYPLGGTRVAEVSTEWSYQHIGIFFDNGAVWSEGEDAINRSSIGFFLGPLKLAVPVHCSNHCGVTFLVHFD
jgi:hypothetical protein